MFFKRSFLIVIVVCVSLLLPTQPQADAQGANCFGLSAADCKILNAAEANLTKETSFQYDFDLTTKYNLGSQTGVGNVMAKGNGGFRLDTDQIGDLSKSDAATILNALKMTLDLDGSVVHKSDNSSFSQKGTFNLIVLDGISYFKTSDRDQWVGQSLDAALKASGSANFNRPNPAAQRLMNDPEFVRLVASIPSIKGFIKLRKTGNAPQLEGQRQIEFVYNFDFPTLFAAKELRPLIKKLLQVSAPGQNFSDTQIGLMGSALSTSITGTTVKVTRWIGTKDNMYHALLIDMAIRVNPRTLGMALTAPISIDVHFGVRLTKLGQDFDVTAPDDVFMITTPTPIPTATRRPTRTPRPTLTPSPTETEVPTDTPEPTETAAPTKTATQTATKMPTKAATATLMPSATTVAGATASQTPISKPSSTSEATTTAAPSNTPTLTATPTGSAK